MPNVTKLGGDIKANHVTANLMPHTDCGFYLPPQEDFESESLTMYVFS